MFPTKGNTRPAATGSGFTLVELMVGMSVTFVIIAVTLAAYTFVGRNYTRMANTQRLEASSRRALSIFSKDISTATLITSATTTQLVLTLPTKTVTYAYSNGALTRTASPANAPEDGNTTLLTHIDTTATSPFRFNYFDTSGTAITGIASVKEVEVTFSSVLSNSSDKLKKSVYTAISPRVALSNRSLLQ